MLADSNGSQFHFTAEPHSTWLVRWGGPTIPYPSSVIRSWKLKWHEQWGGLTLPYPPIGHWSSAVERWSDMSNEEVPPYPTPIGHWSSAVERWSDMSNEEVPPYPTPIGHWSSAVERWSNVSNEEDAPYPIPIGHQQLRVKWHEQCGGPDLTYPFPIGHQQLRVEVTWDVKRTHPILLPNGHQQLRVEVPWAVRRMHPTYPPSVISRWELKWPEQWGRCTLPTAHQLSEVESSSDMRSEEDPSYPTLHLSLYCSASILRPWGFG